MHARTCTRVHAMHFRNSHGFMIRPEFPLLYDYTARRTRVLSVFPKKCARLHAHVCARVCVLDTVSDRFERDPKNRLRRRRERRNPLCVRVHSAASAHARCVHARASSIAGKSDTEIKEDYRTRTLARITHQHERHERTHRHLFCRECCFEWGDVNHSHPSCAATIPLARPALCSDCVKLTKGGLDCGEDARCSRVFTSRVLWPNGKRYRATYARGDRALTRAPTTEHTHLSACQPEREL